MKLNMKTPRPLLSGLKILALCLMLVATHHPVSADLPPEVQADLLQDAIIQNINEKNFAAAKSNIAKYRALGVNVPPAIMMIDAKVAVALKDPLRAAKILEDYFNTFGTKDSGYQNALGLYKKIKPTVDKQQQTNAQIIKFNELIKVGDPWGHIYLSQMYNNGEGVRKDYAEAAKHMRLAADQGIAEAQHNLGAKYRRGKGVPKDLAESAKWYRRAAEQDFTKSMEQLGSIYESGLGVKKDRTEAEKWYRKAAEKGSVFGQKMIGFMYQKGDERGMNRDYAESAKFFRKGAEQGDAASQGQLGIMYRSGGHGLTKDYAEAFKWLRKAADRDDAFAQYDLGKMYQLGEGVKKNPAEAKKWFLKALEHGHTGAKRELGN